MNDLQIKYFLAVAESLSFSHAAEALFVSQPAVSKQISALEEELGFLLFTRKKRQIRLTKAGIKMYHLFIEYSLKYTETIESIKESFSMTNHILHIGYVASWDISDSISKVNKVFENRWSNCTLIFESYSFKSLIKKLTDEEIDIAITFDTILPTSQHFVYKNIGKVQKILLYHENSPVSKIKNPTVNDFKNETLLILDDDINLNASYRENKKMCLDNGFVPAVHIVPNRNTVYDTLAIGKGFSFFDKLSKAINYSGFKNIPLDFYHTICVCYRKDTDNPYINHFVDEFKKQMSSILK